MARTSMAAEIAALKAEIEALKAAKAAKAAPASPFAATAVREGHKMADTRAANLANAVPGKHCPSCKAGFAFRKAACPRCGKAL